ncbi:MAG: hypothetical protein E6Q97_12390 [Desulfurellales bacterium]|nr:MAG: hypothetical protein E6Q97_12390 [Desulfurellales bacterium]
MIVDRLNDPPDILAATFWGWRIDGADSFMSVEFPTHPAVRTDRRLSLSKYPLMQTYNTGVLARV